MRLDDPELVRREYESGASLAVRRAAYSPELLARAFDAVVSALDGPLTGTCTSTVFVATKA